MNTYGFVLGALVGGGGLGFLGYGAGLLRGERRAVAALNKRIKDINEEKQREIAELQQRTAQLA